ncbi:MAG: porin [Pseudanabaena sp.]|nr:MAG: porin [Pseudanabaena sp.]
MKKINSLSVLLGLGLLSSVTSVNAETQVQVIAPSASQSVASESIEVAPSKELVSSSDSATIRAINSQLNSSKAVAQNVTSVSQLSDVRPTDWAFTALQSLVERYGCIAGYPDSTYRGNQATSRYEFAAGLNACLDKINEIISAGLADKVSQEDLATLQKLQEEFAAELATLRGRVDALDAKTAKLEAQQFSTTTKLSGLAFFNVTGVSGNNAVRTPEATSTPTTRTPNITMSGLVWLTLNTSFTGKDSLVTQLAVGNGNSPFNAYTPLNSGFFNSTGVPFTDQTSGAAANTFVLRELSYTFPVFEKASLVVGPRVNFYKYFDGIRFIYPWNTSFNSINNTLLSNAKRGAGAVFMTPLGNQFDFKVGYLSESNEFGPGPSGTSAASPSSGLFGGNNALTAELGFKPSDAFKLRLLYSRTNLASFGGGLVGGVGFTPSLPGTVAGANNAQSDVFAANFDWLLSKGFGLFGRYGYSTTNINLAIGGSSNVVTQTFQVGAAFPDLFKEGALGMVSFGMPFNFTSGKSSLISGAGDGGTQYDLEFSYVLPVTKNISLVPSFYTIFNANNFSSNPTIFVGNLQAVFSF